MWQGFDPEIKRDLAAVKALVRLTHQTPTKEWPLVFVDDGRARVAGWPDHGILDLRNS
jgi:hypothetical protein